MRRVVSNKQGACGIEEHRKRRIMWKAKKMIERAVRCLQLIDEEKINNCC